MKKKKAWIPPTMTVVKILQPCSLLAGSGDGDGGNERIKEDTTPDEFTDY